MSEIFISYSRSTEDKALRIADALRALGYSVWRDDELPPHLPYADVIQERLARAKAVLVLWSDEAIHSQWVRSEANRGRADNKLVQASIDGAEPPMPFDQIHCAQLQGGSGDLCGPDWERVAQSIGDLVGRAPEGIRDDGRSEPRTRDDHAATAEPLTKPRWRARSAWLAAAMAALLLIAALAGGFWLMRASSSGRLTAETPFAVVPFRAVTDDPASKAFAAVAGSDVAGALAEGGLRTVTASDGRGRTLVLDGLVDSDGVRLHTRVRLSDSRSQTTIWSADFTVPAKDTPALRNQVTARAKSVGQITQRALQCASRDFDPPALALMVQGWDFIGGSPRYNMETAAEALVRRAPRYAPGHDLLAYSLLALAIGATPERAAALRARGVAEAQRALSLRPDCYGPQVRLMMAADFRQWRERERLVSQGPGQDGGEGNRYRGWLLLQAGRISDGRQLTEQALEDRPTHTGIGAQLARAIYIGGQPERAIAVAKQHLAMRPEGFFVQEALLHIIALSGDPDEALAILHDPTRRSTRLSPGGAAAYEAFVQWRRSRGPAERDAAIRSIAEAARTRALQRPLTVPMLAAMGALDDAFAAADAFVIDPRTPYRGVFFDTSFLFQAETAAMRRDPRFVPLADKLGLLAYWRETGRRPDFCETEAAPVCSAIGP